MKSRDYKEQFAADSQSCLARFWEVCDPCGFLNETTREPRGLSCGSQHGQNARNCYPSISVDSWESHFTTEFSDSSCCDNDAEPGRI